MQAKEVQAGMQEIVPRGPHGKAGTFCSFWLRARLALAEAYSHLSPRWLWLTAAQCIEVEMTSKLAVIAESLCM